MRDEQDKNAEESIVQRLKVIEQDVQGIEDDELQSMVDSLRTEVAGVARASLGLIGADREHPLIKALDTHFNAKERVLSICEIEQRRRIAQKSFEDDFPRFKEGLPHEPIGRIIDRIWVQTHAQQTDPWHTQEQILRVDQAYMEEAKRRGLDLDAITTMTRDDVDEYIKR